MCALQGPVLAEEETDSETDGGQAGGDRSQPRGRGNGPLQDKTGTSSQGEVELFSPHPRGDRQSACPMIHGHKMSEDIDLSFRNNSESRPPFSLRNTFNVFHHVINLTVSIMLFCIYIHFLKTDMGCINQLQGVVFCFTERWWLQLALHDAKSLKGEIKYIFCGLIKNHICCSDQPWIALISAQHRSN